MAFPLVAGQVIHPANPHWMNDEVGGYSYFNFCSLNYGTCLSHRWAGRRNGFGEFGCRCLIGRELLIKDWAYNSVPDQPIIDITMQLKPDL